MKDEQTQQVMKTAEPTVEQLNNEIQSLHTQLAKAEADKVTLAKMLIPQIDEVNFHLKIAIERKQNSKAEAYRAMLDKITQTLKDCGITA